LFAVAKWTWNKRDREWLLLKKIIDSDCGYAGDERPALLRLTSACAAHGAIDIV
jgi:hypothetical protein